MDAIVKSRIDLDLKTEAERVLTELGLTASDAIRMMFKQIAARQGLPFDVKIPNPQTQSAMRDADAWVAAVRANDEQLASQSTDALFNELSTKK
jgi:addiction module RelB/DinJ family antitoxin